MPKERFEISTHLPVPPERVLRDWLDSKAHSAMTGGEAVIDPDVGGRFSCWDGYIEGKTTVVEPGRIVQKWRTSEFNDDSPDSLLEIRAEAAPGGCTLTLKHSEIPEEAQDRYARGWVEHYFDPMAAHYRAHP